MKQFYVLLFILLAGCKIIGNYSREEENSLSFLREKPTLPGNKIEKLATNWRSSVNRKAQIMGDFMFANASPKTLVQPKDYFSMPFCGNTALATGEIAAHWLDYFITSTLLLLLYRSPFCQTAVEPPQA